MARVLSMRIARCRGGIRIVLKNKRCERCGGKIEESRAAYRQTRYCSKCAALIKRESSKASRFAEDNREYMRNYMREYRAKHRHAVRGKRNRKS